MNQKVVWKNIWINSIKIVLAAMGAILLAQLLHLEFAISAGIVAILTIQPSKRETMYTAMGRLCAFVTALIISFISFTLLGYTIKSFFIYLAIFILLCQIFKWHSAMAMNSVLISHFITLGVMNAETILNEVLLFVIGVGAGIVANMHLRQRTDEMIRLINEMDGQIVKIVSRMADRVLDKDISDYNGECFYVLTDCIDKAKRMAVYNYNNQLLDADMFAVEYVNMRDKQRMVLFEMYKNVRKLDTTPVTAQQIAIFLKNMSEVFEKGNDCKALLEQLRAMDIYMKTQPLPVDRLEFEDRARLFLLMQNIEEFLMIKMAFMKNTHSNIM